MYFLVNPSERRILEDAGDRAPLGLLYLARAYSKNERVKVFDLNHSSEQDLLDAIKKDRPDKIGISCLTSPIVGQVNYLTNRIRAVSNAKIIIGGYHPSIKQDDFTCADHIVIGEGENIKLDKRIVTGEPVDLKQLGTPRRDLLDHRAYNLELEGLRCATAITSRGCPNSCVFCGNPNKQVRYHSLEDVASDLQTIKRQDYDAVYFLDDVFTINKERAKKIGTICKALDLKYRVTTRANYTDEDLVKSLSETGCVCLSMGVESGNDNILKTVGKNQTKEQITNAVELCNKYRINTKGFFIIGLPGETETTARQTIDYAHELKAKGMNTADFYPMIPFPGTPVWTNPSKYDIEIVDTNYANYLQASRDEIYAPAQTKELSSNRIKELIKEARTTW